jgi:hypothetical protein
MPGLKELLIDKKMKEKERLCIVDEILLEEASRKY